MATQLQWPLNTSGASACSHSTRARGFSSFFPTVRLFLRLQFLSFPSSSSFCHWLTFSTSSNSPWILLVSSKFWLLFMTPSFFEMLWREQERSRDRRILATVIVVNASFFSPLRKKAPCFYPRNPHNGSGCYSISLRTSSDPHRFQAVFLSLAVVIQPIVGCS